MMDGLTKARMVLVSIALIAPAGSARADFQVLGGWDKLIPTLTELAGPLELQPKA